MLKFLFWLTTHLTNSLFNVNVKIYWRFGSLVVELFQLCPTNWFFKRANFFLSLSLSVWLLSSTHHQIRLLPFIDRSPETGSEMQVSGHAIGVIYCRYWAIMRGSQGVAGHLFISVISKASLSICLTLTIKTSKQTSALRKVICYLCIDLKQINGRHVCILVLIRQGPKPFIFAREYNCQRN